MTSYHIDKDGNEVSDKIYTLSIDFEDESQLYKAIEILEEAVKNGKLHVRSEAG